MKFKLVETYRYWWPIVVSLPDPNVPGKFISQKLKILFVSQDQDEAVEAQEAYDKLKKVTERIEHEREQLLKLVKDWDDVEDQDGAPLAFSEDVFRAALQKAWFRTAVYNGHADSLIGRAAAVGN